MKTFEKFRTDCLTEGRYITQDEARAAAKNVKVCESCGSPNLFEGEGCVDCGSQNEGVPFKEDAPTNSAGSGNIAGLGVGAQGEPGVSPLYQKKRKQLGLMNGPAVDPRMFADKIFSRRKSVKESTDERKALAADIHKFLTDHGKRNANEPDEWNSPDGHGMEAAAHALHHGQKVYHPRSDWGSGGYKPLNDKAAKKRHDDLVDRIKKHI